MKNRKLAIAIPTFNRPDILNENIRLMLPEIIEFSIPVYISDDSTNDETKTVSEILRKDYENIFYFRNYPGLGHDLNCIKTLKLPAEEYVWYLGDSFAINSGGIRRVLNVISYQVVDLISVNVKGRANINDRIFTEGNELLINLGWHLTLTGTTIYSRNVLARIEELELKKCRNFPQTAIIFQEFDFRNYKLYWLNDYIISCNSRKQSYWKKSVFEVFLNDWNVFISNLPPYYTNENKLIAIKKHSEKTGIFSLYSFLSYRFNGIFDFQTYKRYSDLIRKSSSVNLGLVFIISIFPRKCLGYFRKRLKINY